MSTINHATPLWLAAGTLLAEQGKEFFSRWRKAGATFGVDEIHDLRVASRRLREGLALFAPCFPVKKLSGVSKKVKKLTGILGEMRNTDEAIIFFSSLTEEETDGCRPELEQLLDRLAVEREDSRKELKRDLRALDPAPLRASFRETRRHPRIFGTVSVDPFETIAVYAGTAIEERELPVKELLPLAVHPGEAEAQHRLRIAVKHLRYRLEILSPLLGEGFQLLQQSLKRYQDLLGKLHDLDVFADMVRERVPRGTGQDRLVAILAQRREETHRSFCEFLGEEPLETIGEKARMSL